MGYQVTARKWRPQTFDDVVEQQHVTRTLKNAIRLQRVAHAYLFAGTRGVGKTTMARVLAKALNCEQGPTEQPCNTCQSCQNITQGTALDIIEIDGASNRGIDEIRDLREQLRYLPSRGRYKVYIIDEIHMLTKEAFNALLKTLEEPPPHVVFIFATTEIDKIPQTIISRCQRFEFKRVSLSGIVQQLDAIVQREGISLSQPSLRRIAKAAEGSMRDAQSLLDQVVAYAGMTVQDQDVDALLGQVGSETLGQCLSALLQQDAATALHLVNGLQAEGHEAIGIMRALLEGWRHLIVLKTVPQPDALIPLADADLIVLRTVAKKATVEEIYGHFHVLSAAENSLRHASNPFLVLEMALVRMACIGRVQPLQSILEHLQQFGPELSAAEPIPALPATLGPKSAPVPEPVASTPQPVPPVMERAKPPTEAVPIVSPTQVATATTTSPIASPEGVDIAHVPPAADKDDFWEALQEYVFRQRPSLAAFLQPGHIVSRDEQQLVIGFTKQDNFCRTSLLESENLLTIRTAVQELLGHPLQVTIAPLPEATEANQTAPNHDTAERGPTVEQTRQRKSEFKQLIIDIFHATPI